MQRSKAKKGRPTRRKRRPLLPIILVGGGAIAVVLVFIILTANSGSGGEAVIPTAADGRVAPQSGTVLGEDDAPVTIIEYYSFQCPYCGRFALETEPLIEKEFIERGLVRFEFNALAAEGPSLDAAVAALCAADQGRYWDYNEALFVNYALDRTDAYGIDRLKEYAAALGLDTDAFNGCLDSGEYEDDVLTETTRIIQAGITATPNFFIGLTKDIKGQAPPHPGESNVVGAQEYEVFKTVIENKLEQAQ
jgi:protein-disulfide isomerase